MEISELESLEQSVYADPVVDERFALCDKRTAKMTRHDRPHGVQVKTTGDEKIAPPVAIRFPNLLHREDRVVIRLSGFLHDIGYADSQEDRSSIESSDGTTDKSTRKMDHAHTGAAWAHDYLIKKGFPQAIVQRICRIIANHRSSRVLTRKFDDPAWAVVVMADKCVGDEDRVRTMPALCLRVLRFLHLAKWWPDIHNRVNYAIKNVEVQVINQSTDTPGNSSAIVLTLQIDDLVASPQEIYHLYHKRFHSCGRAAKYLGYLFHLEFNGARYAYSEELLDWKEVESGQDNAQQP